MALAPRPTSSSRRTAAKQSSGRVKVIKSELPLQRYHEVRTFEGGTRTPTLNEALGLSPSPYRPKSTTKRRRGTAREERATFVAAEAARIAAEREETPCG